MSKLYRARSLLYRRQILQENMRWKALDEIYKIYMLLHRSGLNISENFRQTFSHFWQIIILQKFERMLTELRSEKFEWFGPSPIEPFNLGPVGERGVLGRRPRGRRARGRAPARYASRRLGCK